MTVRRVVLYTATGLALGYIAACALILRAADHADYRRGWHDRTTTPRSVP